MGDDQTSFPGFASLRKRCDDHDSNEGERVSEPRLKAIDRAQLLFRTVDVERLIPDDHPARAIWEFVGRLDLSGYTEQVRSVAGVAGRPAFDPQLLVSLWVYSYSQAVSSAREIERRCEHHPAYQWLTGMQSVGAHTLSDFRSTHGALLSELFVQTLGLLSADGLITLERVMLDGTKVRANASGSSFRSKPRVEEFLKDAREAVEALEAQTEEESSRQMQAAQQRARRERTEHMESALKEYNKLEAAKSRVKRVSTTDPDARIMKQAEGGSAPCYNVQVSTDAAHGLIVDIEATQAGSDYQQLTPATERMEQSMQRAPEQMVVDGGYISSSNIAEMAKRNIDFVGPESENKSSEANRRKSYKHYGVSEEYEASKFVFNAETNTYVCPQGKSLRYDAKMESHGAMYYRYKASKQDCETCPAKDQCCPRTRHGRSVQRREPTAELVAFRQKMKTDEAKAIYKTRAQVAEFPNLWIKTKFGLRQFSVRGVAKVRIESKWVALTYNIQQWIRLRGGPKLISNLASA